MADENQTQTSTQTAGETANDIENVMGGMQDAKPETEPTGTAGGDNGTGNKDAADGKGESEVKHPAWMAQLGNIEAESAEKLSKFEKIGDLAKNYLELESKLGNSLVKPGEGASAEEVDAFYRALGKPESADKYTIEGENTDLFRKMAYDNNLTDEQAKAIYASLREVGTNMLEQQKAAFAQQAKETQKALQAEYGKDYSTKIEMLKRGVATYGGKEVADALQQAGLLANQHIVKMFILLGEQSQEAGSPGNGRTKADGYKSIQQGGYLSFGDDFKDK
ncbi:MAG: hypothetical protein J6S67_07115 [Methanobrevibacter sp.]|nr:hypothetical protein [Methanobrevibacter sp.]